VPPVSILFDWVLLSHSHADHGNGLTRVLKDFGTSRFWYSESPNKPALLAKLLKFAQGSNQVTHHESIDTSKQLPHFGDVSMEVLWTPPAVLDSNENNNSVVLAITFGQVTFLLTGDAEADVVWTQIAFADSCYHQILQGATSWGEQWHLRECEHNPLVEHPAEWREIRNQQPCLPACAPRLGSGHRAFRKDSLPDGPPLSHLR
jgi:hypothetical protein